MRNKVVLGLGIGLVSAVCYGCNVPFARQAAQAGVMGPDLIFYRAILMSGLLAALIKVSGGGLAVPRSARLPVLGLTIGTSFVGICYISSVAFIPVSMATIIYYTYPLLILIIGPLVDKERVTLARLGIFALAFAGLIIAIGPSFSSFGGSDGLGHTAIGIVLAALGAGGAVAQFFFASRSTGAIGVLAAGFWTQLLIIPVAFAVCLSIGGPASPATMAGAAAPTLFHVGLFLFAFVFQLAAARLAPPVLLGFVFCAEPVASIVLAVGLLREPLTQPQLLGGLLVLAAIALSLRTAGRRKKAAEAF